MWTVAGFLGLGVSLRLLRTPRPWLVLSVAAASLNGYIGVWVGQAQMFWAALYGAILWRLRGAAQIQAGLLPLFCRSNLNSLRRFYCGG